MGSGRASISWQVNPKGGDHVMRDTARRWTPADDDKLRDVLDVRKTAEEIAVDLNRTHLAIYARLQRLYRIKRARKARLVEPRVDRSEAAIRSHASLLNLTLAKGQRGPKAKKLATRFPSRSSQWRPIASQSSPSRPKTQRGRGLLRGREGADQTQVGQPRRRPALRLLFDSARSVGYSG
jgi:hypothetical protein